jgi:hypothetical protein
MSPILKTLVVGIATATAALAFAQGTPPRPAADPAVGAGQRSTQNTPMGMTGTPGGGGAAAQSGTSGGASSSSSATVSSGTSAGSSGNMGSGSSMAAGSGTGGGKAATGKRRARADRG